MRTTFTLADDVAAEVDALRRRAGIGVSEAVNQLIRQGLAQTPPAHVYVNTPSALGLTVDVSNIGEVLDVLGDAVGRQ